MIANSNNSPQKRQVTLPMCNNTDIWSTTFDLVDDIVTVQSRDFTIIRANKAAERILSEDETNLIGNKCYEVFSGRAQPCTECPFRLSHPTNRSYSAIIKHEVLQKTFQIKSSFIPSGSGGEEYLVHVARDITKDLEANNNLQESSIFFLEAFQSNAVPMVISEMDSNLCVDVNQRWIDMLGYSKEELIGKSLKDLEMFKDPKARDHVFATLSAQNFLSNSPITLLTITGEPHFVLWSADKVVSNGQALMFSLLIDITEQEKAERKLEKSAEEVLDQKLLLKTTFNAIENGMVITDENRKILFANRAMKKIFGYSPDKLRGGTTEILYSNSKAFELAGKNVFNANSVQKDRRYVTTYRHRSGKEFPGETFGVKLYDQKNNWIGNLSIMKDVSERQMAEAERDRLIAAIEQTSDAIVITDNNANILYVNPAHELVTGYSRNEVLGLNPRIFKSGEHDSQFYQFFWQTLNSGQTFKGRMVNRRKDGKISTVEATISPIFDREGQIINFVAVKRDITEQILLESQLQQAQKMEAVGRLTGGVAHDFNNTLAVIIGYTEMALEDTDSNHELHAILENIFDAAERSADIVRQLLAFSRKQTISPKVIDLNNAVVGILKMLHRLIGENIDLSLIPEPEALLIKIDPTQIDQILANLCVNAKDAINGSGKISIETARVTFDQEYCTDHFGFHTGDFVQLSVSDSGCGIDKETQNHIFEPFFSTKELGQGTGLGLSTVYGIVKQNKGFINVYSELGNGTVFKIYLPACEIERSGSKKVAMEKNWKSTGETILLVEDDSALLAMAKRMLELMEYTVLATRLPNEALRIAENYQGNIDLIFSDVVMPEMTGKELTNLILQFHPNVKILFTSGYTADVIAHNGILDEGIQFIQKPYSKDDLYRKIRTVLTE